MAHLLVSPRNGAELTRWGRFEEAIASYQSELHAFAYRILGGRSEAEDALQTAYLKAFRAAADDQVRLTRPWLYRVVYRCCIDELRRLKRHNHDVLENAAAGVTDDEATRELSRALSHAFLQLPAPTRAAVLLVDVHGFSYAEAAAALDVPRGTIASRLNHGRDALRVALTDDVTDWRAR